MGDEKGLDDDRWEGYLTEATVEYLSVVICKALRPCELFLTDSTDPTHPLTSENQGSLATPLERTFILISETKLLKEFRGSHVNI